MSRLPSPLKSPVDELCETSLGPEITDGTNCPGATCRYAIGSAGTHGFSECGMKKKSSSPLWSRSAMRAADVPEIVVMPSRACGSRITVPPGNAEKM